MVRFELGSLLTGIVAGLGLIMFPHLLSDWEAGPTEPVHPQVDFLLFRERTLSNATVSYVLYGKSKRGQVRSGARARLHRKTGSRQRHTARIPRQDWSRLRRNYSARDALSKWRKRHRSLKIDWLAPRGRRRSVKKIRGEIAAPEEDDLEPGKPPGVVYTKLLHVQQPPLELMKPPPSVARPPPSQEAAAATPPQNAYDAYADIVNQYAKEHPGDDLHTMLTQAGLLELESAIRQYSETEEGKLVTMAIQGGSRPADALAALERLISGMPEAEKTPRIQQLYGNLLQYRMLHELNGLPGQTGGEGGKAPSPPEANPPAPAGGLEF